jgi:uncharacterized protein
VAKEFLGRGWRFPVVPDASGGLGYVEGDDNVDQSLRLLLLTRVGERVMRADFGTGLGTFVFAPGSAQRLRALEREVREATARWEPRVELLDVVAEQDARQPTHANVRIKYRVRRSETRSDISLVFPYYLPRVETS